MKETYLVCVWYYMESEDWYKIDLTPEEAEALRKKYEKNGSHYFDSIMLIKPKDWIEGLPQWTDR